MTDRCILCEASPPPPLTPEHIWPDWYSRTLPKSRRHEFIGMVNGVERRWATRKLNLVNHCLCRECNGVWGSRLEQAVKPDLGPMSKGERQTLSGASMRRLAQWATLKFMVIDAMRPVDEWFFSQAHRHHLWSRGVPPPRVVTLWLGRYTGASSFSGRFDEHRSDLYFASDVAQTYPCWTAELSVGQAVFQMWAITGATHIDPSTVTITQSPYDWGKVMYRIWPPPQNPVQWPPDYVIEEKDWQELRERWTQPDGPLR